MKEVFIKIYGQVHGVCFRMDTKDLAKNLNLTGWVKNVDDGTVEILAQGNLEDLKEIEQWAHKGPSLANVEKVEINYRDTKEKINDFIIKYN